ncbi:glutaredoxin family protein [bacterium]|nr:glutaredoxin family protein [bacterium]
MFRFLVMLCFAFLCLVPVQLSAEVFKYVDSSGVSVYVSSLEEVPAEYRSQVTDPHDLPAITKSDYPGYSPEKSAPATKAPAAPEVELYVTSWCGYCAKAENFMRKNGVRYQKYDIEKNPTGKRRYQELGGGGVPIIKIGSSVVRGFNAPLLRRKLNL